MSNRFDLRGQTDHHAIVYDNEDQVVAHVHLQPDGTWITRFERFWNPNGVRWAPSPAVTPEDALQQIQDWAAKLDDDFRDDVDGELSQRYPRVEANE